MSNVNDLLVAEAQRAIAEALARKAERDASKPAKAPKAQPEGGAVFVTATASGKVAIGVRLAKGTVAHQPETWAECKRHQDEIDALSARLRAAGVLG